MISRLHALVLAFAAALALAAGPAAAAELTATAANAVAAFGKAKGGDTLRLTGDFPDTLVVYAPGRVYDPPLDVEAQGATFSAVVLNGLSGVHWSGGTFTGAPGRPGVVVTGKGRDLTLTDIDFRGDGTRDGVVFRDVSAVALTASRLDRPRSGVQVVDVTGAKIVGNAVWGWSADAFGTGASRDVEYALNLCAVPMPIDLALPPEQRIHVDCFQGYAGATPNVNILIARNLVWGDTTQGVWFNTIAPYPPARFVAANDNVVVNADGPNGVVVDGLTNAANDNRVWNLPWSRWVTQVRALNGATSCGNRAEAFKAWKAVIEAPCAGSDPSPATAELAAARAEAAALRDQLAAAEARIAAAQAALLASK